MVSNDDFGLEKNLNQVMTTSNDKLLPCRLEFRHLCSCSCAGNRVFDVTRFDFSVLECFRDV